MRNSPDSLALAFSTFSNLFMEGHRDLFLERPRPPSFNFVHDALLAKIQTSCAASNAFSR